MGNIIKTDDLPYRPCVGIMVLNHDGLVWVGKRLLSNAHEEHENTPYRWQMPQGGIDKGEDPEAASRRELYEETGMHNIELIAQSADWLTYDLPDDLIGIGLKGKYRGQKQKWFVYRFIGEENEIQINPPITGEKAEFEQWAWRPMHELPDLIVPFKRNLYEEIVNEFSKWAGK